MTLAIERSLAAQGHLTVAGVDEVGRGAIAGPVSVGVVAIDLGASPSSPPAGLADSKQLSPAKRSNLVQPIHQWASAAAVGHATSAEIDELGIISALGLAGRRALMETANQLREKGSPLPSVVILDGNIDWLAKGGHALDFELPAVNLVVGGDRLSATVAAASVIAKVERDALMSRLDSEHPAYGWASNKGYASASHRDALATLGLTDLHRKSWQILP